MKADRAQLRMFAAAATIAASVFVLEQIGFWSSFDARLRDKLMERRPVSTNIVIVAIDNKSIQEFGIWPWPRTLHAAMIDLLAKAGADTIGYDVTFAERSTKEADAALAASLRGRRVVLASEATLAITGNDSPTATEPVIPLEDFRKNASFGATTLYTERDGIVRRAPIKITRDGREEETFAAILAGDSDAALLMDTFFWPLESGLYRIPYTGSRYETFSFSDVHDGRVSPSVFAGKIVLVGATAPDLHDEVLTPFSYGRAMPGVEVQANILQGIIDNKTLLLLPPSLMGVLYLLLALGVTLIFRLRRFRIAGPLTVLVGLSYIIAALAAASRGLLLPVLYPLLIIAGVTSFDLAQRYYTEKNRRQFIQDAFGHYLAPQVIAKLISGEAPLELGGTKKELTILFSDIRGFTTLSEKLTPEQLVSLLNEYLSAMTDVILSTEGVVDKYIGDAIMSFWGAPMPQSDHAVRAATAALKMKARLTELRAGWKERSLPEINIGVGLNCGEVVVGNMGSNLRFDYTVMGDDVNLASRLEGLTKQYGVTILISEAVRAKIGERFTTRFMDLVAVKGKTQPVLIYELISDGELTPNVRSLLTTWASAMEKYRARKWDEAKADFESIADDAASAMYAKRCEHMKAHDPGESWDGVYVAKEK